MLFAERYDATYTVTEMSPEGHMEVRVSWYEDESGNMGEPYSSEYGVVEIDTTAPSVSDVSAWSSGPDMHYAKAGDVITVALETSESVLGAIEVSLEVSARAVDAADLEEAYLEEDDGSMSWSSGLEDDQESVDSAGCSDSVCTRAMTVSAERVPSPAEASCAMFGMVLCGVVDGLSLIHI